MKITSRATDSVLVGLLLILVDFRLGAAGFDMIPDVLGWLFFAGGLGSLLGFSSSGAAGRYWRPARTLAWVLVVTGAILAALSLLGSFGAYPTLELGGGLALVGVVSLDLVLAPVVFALLGRGGEGRARAYGAESALIWLRIGWITALVVAGLSLVGALSALLGTRLLPGLDSLGPLLYIATLVAGVLVGVGISKMRNEGALD